MTASAKAAGFFGPSLCQAKEMHLISPARTTYYPSDCPSAGWFSARFVSYSDRLLTFGAGQSEKNAQEFALFS